MADILIGSKEETQNRLLKLLVNTEGIDDATRQKVYTGFHQASSAPQLIQSLAFENIPDEKKTEVVKMWQELHTLPPQNQGANQVMNTIGNILYKAPIGVAMAGGAILGGPGGAATAGTAMDSLLNVYGTAVDRYMDKNYPGVERQKLGPQTNTEALINPLISGAMGLAAPEALATKFPLAQNVNRAEELGAYLPGKMSYKQAKEFQRNQEIMRTNLQMQNAERQFAFNEQIRQQKIALQQEFSADIERNVESLRRQATQLTENNATKINKIRMEEALTAELRDTDLALLKQEMTTRTAKVNQEAWENAQIFSKAVGRAESKARMQLGVAQAEKFGYDAYTAQSSKLTKQIEAEVFAKNPKRVPTGKIIPEHKDAAGKLIPAKQETRLVAGGIDRSAMKKAFEPFAKEYKEDLEIAKQLGSPGARAILEIVNGDDWVSGVTALNDLAALNRAGWHHSDYVIRDYGTHLVREVATKYRRSIMDSVAKMENGKIGLDLLAERRAILAARDRIYRTGSGVGEFMNEPVAKQSMDNLAKEGEINSLWNDPVRTKNVYDALDDVAGNPNLKLDSKIVKNAASTKAALKARVGEKVLGENYQQFSKNWQNMDPEFKQLNFTPEQIQRGDRLITEGPEALRKIADEELIRQNQIIADSKATLRSLKAERMTVGENAREIRALREQMRTETRNAQRTRLAKTINLNTTNALLRKELKETELFEKYLLNQKIRDANKKIEDIKAITYRLAIGGAAAASGLGVLEWRTHRIAKLLGFAP